MITKEINCPRCGKHLEYWTIGDFIECSGCKEQIQVEPCENENVMINNTIENDRVEVLRIDV